MGDGTSSQLCSALKLRQVPSEDRGTARIPSIRSASHLSDSGILLPFAGRVSIVDPCSETTTASDDEFSIPTNTPRWHRGSHFPPLAGLADVYEIFSKIPESVCCPFVDATCVVGVFPSLTIPVHQIRSELHQRAQYPCIMRDFQCSGLTSHESDCVFDDSIGLVFPTGGVSGTVGLPSWQACVITLANASIASSLSHLSVTLLCPSWSMNWRLDHRTTWRSQVDTAESHRCV